jgi:hypothetical protein
MTAKALKAVVLAVVGLVVLAGIGFGGFYYYKTDTTEANTQKYTHSVGHINQSKALLNDVYALCDSIRLYDLHSPRHLRVYEGSKKVFRESVLKAHDSIAYSDSGYLSFRFIVNCKGEPGWFEIRQTDLQYHETELDKALVDELLDITATPEHWAVRNVNNEAVDYYMYIIYRIENGKITEILP